jgi:hypothetical protein
MSGRLWAVQTRASAGQGCAYPAGQRHDILVFAKAEDSGGAIQRALKALTDNGWLDLETSRSGEIDPSRIDPANAELSAAFNGAMTNGWGMLIYQTPIAEQD